MSAALKTVTQRNDGYIPTQDASSLPPPEAALTQMLAAPLVTQALRVVAELGIADLLATKARRSVDELAAETGAHAPSLYRFMRALASCGVFVETGERVFESTPMAELLRSDIEGSLRDLAIFMGADWHWSVWGDAPYSARTGRVAWEHVHGKEVFPYFAENREAARVFDNAMTSLSKMVAKAVVGAYDFSAIGKLADIAGGHGSLLAAILQANAHLKGLLFDVPQVIAGVRDRLEAEGVAERCELASGDRKCKKRLFTGGREESKERQEGNSFPVSSRLPLCLTAARQTRSVSATLRRARESCGACGRRRAHQSSAAQSAR